MENTTNKKGSTLIEIIIYFAILATVLFAILVFAIQIFNVNSLSTNFNELQTNLDIITERLVQTIQTADSVDDSGSTFDNPAGALSLNMSNSVDSPTRFYLSNNDLFMTKGPSAAIKLNSSLVQFDTLTFHKVSFSKSPDQIIIDAQVSAKGVEVEYLKKDLALHVSISLRK